MQNKYGEFKIKRVFLILSHGKWLTGFGELARSLKEQGIDCIAMLAEETWPEEQGALYITDDEQVLGRLKCRGLPTAVYLHEENKERNMSAVRYAFEEPRSLDAIYAERVYRRYQDIPWDILETERCFLRETVPEDVDAFYEIYSDPQVTRYTEDLYESKVSERAYIREYIERIYKYFEFGVWTIFWKETGEIIGRAGLNVREGYDMPELGYVIAHPWQGKGIATEVCREILKYARSEFGFERVMTLIQKENTASMQVAGKLGFLLQDERFVKDAAYCFLIWEASEKED